MRGGCPLCVKVAANLKSPVPSSDPTPDKMRVQILSPQRILRFWEWRWEMRNLYFSLCLSMLIAGCRLQINKSYLISDNILLTGWFTNPPKKLLRTYFYRPNEGCQVADWGNKVRVWPYKFSKVFSECLGLAPPGTLQRCMDRAMRGENLLTCKQNWVLGKRIQS